MRAVVANNSPLLVTFLAVSNTAPVLNFNPGISVACVNGFQNFTGYQYPGLITNHPTGTEDYSVAGKWKVPINVRG